MVVITTTAYASKNKSGQIFFKITTIATVDTIPQKQQIPKDKKQKNPDVNKGKVKKVPKARPMPKPKIVGPKVKPVKVIKPKLKVKM